MALYPRSACPARVLAPLAVILNLGVTYAGAENLCAYRTESGAIVHTNTPDKDGLCAVAADAPPAPPASPSVVSRYDRAIRTNATRYGVSARLVHAVIATESAYNPGAVSPKGAKGLMQLMPATARGYGVSDLFDPEQNIHAGVAHLRDLLDAFGGDPRLAVAAYNAGAEAVRKYSGIPPYAETRQYVARVLSRMGGKAGGIVRSRQASIVRSPIEVRIDPAGAISLVN